MDNVSVGESWSISEASRASGVSRTTIHRLLKDGRLRQFEVIDGSRRKLRADGLVEFLRGGGVRVRIDSPWAEWGQQRQDDRPPAAPVPEGGAITDAEARFSFWIVDGYGKMAGPDDSELSDAEFWQHVAKIVSGMSGEEYSPGQIADLVYFTREAMADVEAGIRWDQACWDRACARQLIGEVQCDDAGVADAGAQELQRMLDDGRIEDALLAEVQELLATHARNKLGAR